MLPRYRVEPNLNLLKDYTTRRLLSWFIYNKAWFSEQSQQTTGELFKILDAFAYSLAKYEYDWKRAHYSRFLPTAIGDALSSLGAAFGSPRRANETSDDAYAQRVQFELLADRVTRNAFERIAQQYADFVNLGTLSVNETTEPGRKGFFSSNSDINRSYWMGRKYYRGGVALIRLSQPLLDFDGYVTRSLAAGVTYRIRYEIPNGVLLDGGTEIAAGQLMVALSTLADDSIQLAGTTFSHGPASANADFRPVLTLGMSNLIEAFDGNNILIESANTLGMLVHTVSHNPIVLGTLEPTNLQPPVQIEINPTLVDEADVGDDHFFIA